ncbi:S-adenosyl-L-methionine-dependent methyltransferase [Rhexocercosporidium sp. MPI-PUGE-AT-0058]|nr:S-adenosyl-L-methionine-dependent methyltransferase [Rhexocercosporidium sp. MPI-PUGE-AT-0058]
MDNLCRSALYGSLRFNGSISRRRFVRYECQRNLSTTVSLKAAKPPKRKPKPDTPHKSSTTTTPKARHEHKPYTLRVNTTKPGPTSSNPEPKSNPFRHRIIPIFFGSIALVGFSGGMSYYYVMFNQDADGPRKTTPAIQEDVSKRYDQIATTFDNTVDSTESMMGISSLRRKLASQAVGDVLEVSIGTGRNLEFYSWDFKGYQGVGKVDERGFIKKGKVRSFTAVDKSAEMLEIAHEKFGKMFPGILGVRWIIADAAEKGAIPGPPRSANEMSGNLEKKYDTVVQTMGLCSVSDPVALLRNLGECVKEDEGRILLLEHGRGKWEWLNKYLDRSAESHAKLYGCWWNRDMRSIVEESGLEVVKIETPKWWHGGTTWWIELKKPIAQSKIVEAQQKIKLASSAVESEKKEEPLPLTAKSKKKGWW